MATIYDEERKKRIADDAISQARAQSFTKSITPAQSIQRSTSIPRQPMSNVYGTGLNSSGAFDDAYSVKANSVQSQLLNLPLATENAKEDYLAQARRLSRSEGETLANMGVDSGANAQITLARNARTTSGIADIENQETALKTQLEGQLGDAASERSINLETLRQKQTAERFANDQLKYEADIAQKKIAAEQQAAVMDNFMTRLKTEVNTFGKVLSQDIADYFGMPVGTPSLDAMKFYDGAALDRVKLEETIRSNKVGETETARSNRADESLSQQRIYASETSTPKTYANALADPAGKAVYESAYKLINSKDELMEAPKYNTNQVLDYLDSTLGDNATYFKQIAYALGLTDVEINSWLGSGANLSAPSTIKNAPRFPLPNGTYPKLGG